MYSPILNCSFFEQILGFLINKTNHFVLAKYFSGNALGLFAMASSVAPMYGQEISASIDKSNFSHLSGLINNGASASAATQREIVSENLVYVFRAKDVLILPVYVALFSFSAVIVSILFGPNWLDMAKWFAGLALVGLLDSYSYTLRTIANSMRKPQLNFYIAICSITLIALSSYLSVAKNNAEIILYSLPLISLFAIFQYSVVLWVWFKLNILTYLFRSFIICSIYFIVAAFIKVYLGEQVGGLALFIFFVIMFLCGFYRYSVDPFLSDIKTIVKKYLSR
jgi:hypothetical protein